MLREVGQKRMTLDEKKRRRRALDHIGLPDFDETLASEELTLDRTVR